jgi:hypothetical protein
VNRTSSAPRVESLRAHPDRPSVGLSRDLVLAHVTDDLLVLAASVARFHEEVIVLGGDRLPLGGVDVNGAMALLVSALAEEPNPPRIGAAVLDCGEEPLIGPAEAELGLLAARLARGHHASMPAL